jgi:hypothetical protein
MNYSCDTCGGPIDRDGLPVITVTPPTLDRLVRFLRDLDAEQVSLSFVPSA